MSSGQSGAGTDSYRTKWYWDIFIVDRVALGQIHIAQSGTGTYSYSTRWHWDIFI